MQKAVELLSRGLTLRGMLHRPEDISAKLPAAVIFHGFTGNKMEPHFIFVKLSRMLEKRGIASIRFDFGGSGESDGEFCDMTLSGEVEDAVNILDYAMSLDFVDTSRIAAVGLSMGGAVASILAGRRKDDIRALCLWAPAGNMGELVTEGMLKAENPDAINRMKRLGYADLNGFKLGIGFVEDVIRLDIFKMASPYDGNVFIIHGDNDQTVPLETSRKYLEVYGDAARLHIVKGADHTFNSLAWEGEVLDETVNFLLEELCGEAIGHSF